MMNAPPINTYIPPDVSTVKTLNKITGIIALIFGIILVIMGLATILFLVGIVPLIFGIIDLVIYFKIKDIDALIDQQRYNEAKEKTLVWMIIGFILSGVIVGILLLIAWLKYDNIIRAVQQSYMQQGQVQANPPQPPVQ